MAVLAIGLFATGIGTMVFLRNTLLGNLDASLQQLVSTDAAGDLFDIEVRDGVISFREDRDAAGTDHFVAVYDPDGALVASAGGDGAAEPVFPETFELAETTTRGTAPFELTNSAGGPPYRASVDVLPISGTGTLYTQLVALPVAPIDRLVGTYLGIYGLLALLTILAGALGTRGLVTLTFRGLGQVENTAMAIANGDFSQRMTDIEPGTEVGRLKTAINTMLNRVDAALSQRDATVRQMRRFIGDASHELRTPLVTVRGYAELYRMGAITGEDDIAQSMERIEKEAIRMGVLVEDLLALARLDERRDVVVAPVDLREIARDAALDARAASPLRTVSVIDTTVEAPETFEAVEAHVAEDGEAEPAAARRRGGGAPRSSARGGATLGLLRRRSKPVAATAAQGTGAAALHPLVLSDDQPAADAPAPIVLGDENRIRQVVANLLGNARRFTAEDSPIELSVGVDRVAGMGWIAVADHGEGIPEQIRDKIFERFWRADTSRTRETGGSGLGLAIVTSIVDALHGFIVVEDTPGGGATFRVGFPLAEERKPDEHLYVETQPLPRLRPSGS